MTTEFMSPSVSLVCLFYCRTRRVNWFRINVHASLSFNLRLHACMRLCFCVLVRFSVVLDMHLWKLYSNNYSPQRQWNLVNIHRCSLRLRWIIVKYFNNKTIKISHRMLIQCAGLYEHNSHSLVNLKTIYISFLLLNLTSWTHILDVFGKTTVMKSPETSLQICPS